MIAFKSTEQCKLVKRPSKVIKSPYVGDISLNEKEYLAHCPSLGLGNILCCDSDLIVSKSTNEKSKTDYIIEAVKDNDTWVGNIPLNANRMVKQLLESSTLLPDVAYIKPEYKMGDSRLDFYVKDTNDNEFYIEVKSVHIKLNNKAIFPVGYKGKKQETVSERANKHVKHLTELSNEGKNTMLVFVVQRNDCDIFEPYFDKDPIFSKLLYEAHEAGVKIKVLQCSIDECCMKFEKFMDYNLTNHLRRNEESVV